MKDLCKELIIVGHSSNEKSAKPPKYAVTMKNSVPIENEIQVTLKLSCDSDIRQEFPMNEVLEVSLRKAKSQTKLIVDEPTEESDSEDEEPLT